MAASGDPIDSRLLVGAALFGLGWGSTGFCPGPLLVAAVARPAPGPATALAGAWLGVVACSQIFGKAKAAPLSGTRKAPAMG